MSTDLDRRSKRGRELAARLNLQTAIETTRFYYFEDDCNQAWRIWQSCSPGDVFDVLPYKGNEPLIAWFKMHPGMFIHGEPDEEES